MLRKQRMSYGAIGHKIARLNRGFYCYYCLAELIPPGIQEADALAMAARGARRGTVDHLVPLARGGNYDDANMVLACLECNVEKGTMTLGEFLVWKRKSK